MKKAFTKFAITIVAMAVFTFVFYFMFLSSQHKQFVERGKAYKQTEKDLSKVMNVSEQKAEELNLTTAIEIQYLDIKSGKYDGKMVKLQGSIDSVYMRYDKMMFNVQRVEKHNPEYAVYSVIVPESKATLHNKMKPGDSVTVIGKFLGKVDSMPTIEAQGIDIFFK